MDSLPSQLSTLPLANDESNESGFSTLTSVCFNILCSHLRLQDLFKCAGVNRHWRAHVFDYCHTQVHWLRIALLHPEYDIYFLKEKDHEARGFHLLTNDNGERMYPAKSKKNFHSLEWKDFGPAFWPDYTSLKPGCPLFSRPLARTLVNFFASSNLHTLEMGVVLEDEAAMDGVIYLITELRSSLTTLCLCIESLWIKNGEQHKLHKKLKPECVRDLFTTLNTMHRLERLTLKNFIPMGLEGVEPDFAFLGWLHEFEFLPSDHRVNDLEYAALCRYVAENPRLTRLINCDSTLMHEPDFSTEEGRRVASRIVNLNEFDFHAKLQNYSKHLGSYYPSVTFVDIFMGLQHWWDNIRRLAELPQLFELKIFIHSSRSQEDYGLRYASSRFARHSAESLRLTLEATPSHLRLPVLSHVKLFHLAAYMEHARLVSLLQLPHLFPCIQVCTLEYNNFSLPCCWACWEEHVLDNEAAQLDACVDADPLQHKQRQVTTAIEHCLPATFQEFRKRGQKRLKYLRVIDREKVNLLTFNASSFSEE